MTAKTTQLAENLSLEEFGSDETQLARELAGRIQQLHKTNNKTSIATGSESTKSTKAAVQRMTFNPLHPSMELPPEQLIRLMGMHAQQIAIEARKHRTKKKFVAVTEPPHATAAAPGLLELEYSDEYESPKPYKRLAIAILALAGLSAYPALKYLADKPASVASEQPRIEQTLPVQDAAPIPERVTPAPAIKPQAKKPQTKKPVAANQALNPEPLPIAAIPAEIKAPPHESVSNQSANETPVVEEPPATETQPIIEDTFEMNSDDVLDTEPESGIQVSPGLIERFPEDESATIDSLESDATTSETATITPDTTETEDTPEIEVTNTIDIETTTLPTAEIHDKAFPDEDL